MTFYEAICELYNDDFDKINSSLINSVFVKSIEEYSPYVYSTGFVFNKSDILSPSVEVLFDPFKGKLIHQCGFNSYSPIPRHMGLKMWLNRNYYMPFQKTNYRNEYIINYYTSFDLKKDSFDKHLPIAIKIPTIYKESGPELQLIHSSDIRSKIISILKETVKETFLFTFLLADKSDPLFFQFTKFYPDSHFLKHSLKDFDKDCRRPFKIGAGYYDLEKWAENELKSWDEFNPGWSDGLWD